jgi:hypothetical protein
MLKRIIFGIVAAILILAAIAITLVIVLTRKSDTTMTSTTTLDSVSTEKARTTTAMFIGMLFVVRYKCNRKCVVL